MPVETPVAVAVPALSHKAKVQVRLAGNVTFDHINNIVKTIGGRYGCLTCGLGGIDLTLSGDPVEALEFAKIAGVQSVAVD